MTTHPSIPTWRISWTEEASRLSPWGFRESDTTEQLTLLSGKPQRDCRIPSSYSTVLISPP